MSKILYLSNAFPITAMVGGLLIALLIVSTATGVHAQELVQDLYKRGMIDIREAFIDGSFAPAKKRGLAVGKTTRGKGTKIMAIADAAGLPVAA